MEQIFKQNFWQAFGAIFTMITAFGVWYAARQIRFERWIKAQKIFIENQFTKSRTIILKYFGYESEKPKIQEDHIEDAMTVCRNMDELARLNPYIRKSKIIKIWGYSIGKSWMLLGYIVDKERELNPYKWNAFKKLG